MRSQRTVWYTVMDTGRGDGIWWVPGHGWTNIDAEPTPNYRGTMSNTRRYNTMKQAYRAASKIVAKGGKPSITQWFTKRGRRYAREYWVPGHLRWT